MNIMILVVRINDYIIMNYTWSSHHQPLLLVPLLVPHAAHVAAYEKRILAVFLATVRILLKM